MYTVHMFVCLYKLQYTILLFLLRHIHFKEPFTLIAEQSSADTRKYACSVKGASRKRAE